MCFPKTPKIDNTTTPPPSAVADTAVSAGTATEVASSEKNKRKGKSQLVIDLTSAGSSGGSGLNIPL